MTADLAVAWLHPGEVAGEFCRSLLDCARHSELGPRIATMSGCLCGPLLSMGRTMIVDDFLSGDAPWLLMVDADVRFSPADVLRLLDAADPEQAPILAGLYLGYAGSGITAMAGHWAESGWMPLSEWGADELVSIDVAGAGCLLIHRGVFTTLAERYPRPLPWFAQSVRGGLIMGEDIEFCLRAREAGFPIHVHTGARIGHRKARVLMPPASYPVDHVPISSTADAARPQSGSTIGTRLTTSVGRTGSTAA